MKVLFRVQHAFGREGVLDRLLPLLPPEVEVITDHQAMSSLSPWRGFRLCFDDLPQGFSHLCIIQDDARPCKNFAERLTEAVAERPNEVLSFFVGGLPSRTKKDFEQALAKGERWSPVWFREIHHVVCLCWPIHLAESFREWVDTAKIPGANPPRSDDAVVGFWARKHRHVGPVLAHVPCLVQHDDEFPSLVQGPNRFSDRGRRAIAFVDDLV